jgi:hypothetical protein
METEKTKLDFGAVYGMSARCNAILERDELVGQTSRQLVLKVAETEQHNEPAVRAARVLRDVIRSHRFVGVEVSSGSKENIEQGERIGLDDVIFKPDNGKIKTDRMTLRINEPYVGGYK